jgi:chemotaxis methyl-accepting protein methylase/mannose-6-phosphate isomerase-like protein (cupin superfamily)
MPYTYSLPTSVSFTGKGLLGYSFGPLNQKDLDIYYIEVEKGHDVFMVSKKITRTYYVLSGSGYFTINNQQYPVSAGVLVEVPPRVEYCYSGKMTLLAISIPRWSTGNDTFTKWNPDVLGFDSPCATDAPSWWTRIVRARVLGKSPVSAYLRVNQWLWSKLPGSMLNFGPISIYGMALHKLACIQGRREQAFSTFFLRNRPELESIRRLVKGKDIGDTLTMTVLGCSTGAEAYSIAWRIRSARPDLRLVLNAMDISKQAVEFAKQGVYSTIKSELSSTAIFERMTQTEMLEFFDKEGEAMVVKPWIREGMHWQVGDAGHSDIFDLLGPQDIVVASNFLCHMDNSEAERCLRNIGRLVRPNGYLFVSGIETDVRSRVASNLGWKPLEDLLEEIHEGEPFMRSLWPCHYAGLEPLNKRRADWKMRYATGFQLPSHRDGVMNPGMEEEAMTAASSDVTRQTMGVSQNH